MGCFDGVFRSAIAADWIVAISKASRDHYLNVFPHFPKDRIRIIYPCSRFADSSAQGIRSKALDGVSAGGYWLNVGTIEPRKNILVVVDGFVESGLAEKGYELVVVGAKGWKNKHVLQKLEQTSGIRYIGCIEAKEKAFFYKGASIFVYPSLYEGFGFPVLEAMASGVPVVTSNRSSLPEVAGGAAYYVNPSNSSEIALALKRFEEESDLSQFFIQRGREHREQFCWKKTAEQFLDLL